MLCATTTLAPSSCPPSVLCASTSAILLCPSVRCATTSTILLHSLDAVFTGVSIGPDSVKVTSTDHKQTLVPEYSQSSASSVYANDAMGHSHGLGKLDSPLAWCASTNAAGQYWQMDLSSAQSVGGVVTQGRKDASYQVRIN